MRDEGKRIHGAGGTEHRRHPGKVFCVDLTMGHCRLHLPCACARRFVRSPSRVQYNVGAFGWELRSEASHVQSQQELELSWSSPVLDVPGSAERRGRPASENWVCLLSPEAGRVVRSPCEPSGQHCLRSPPPGRPPSSLCPQPALCVWELVPEDKASCSSLHSALSRVPHRLGSIPSNAQLASWSLGTPPQPFPPHAH